MAGANKGHWEWLGNVSATAFILTGVAWLVLIVLVAVDMYAGVAVPDWLVPVFLIVGLLAAHVGLLGFYPEVTDSAPRLSFVGVWATAIAAALVVLAIVSTVATSAFAEGPPEPVSPLIFVMTILGFLSLGVASERTDTPSRFIGLLLLVPVVVWIGDIVFVVASWALGFDQIAGLSLLVIPMISLVIASIAMVTIGYLLHIQQFPTDGVEPSSDPTGK